MEFTNNFLGCYTVVNITIDSNTFAMPQIELKQMTGFAKARGRLIWNDKLDEVWDTAKSNIKYLKSML